MIPRTIRVFMLLAGMHLTLVSVISCERDTTDPAEQKSYYFLSEIRPVFFENVNFESTEVVKHIPQFKEDFYTTFNQLESQFKAGDFTSEEDIYYFRLASAYYGFYLTGLLGAYLDSNLTFEQITGNRSTGLFSGVPASQADFKDRELNAMSTRSVEILQQAVTINNTTDQRTYGFYLLCRLVNSRLQSGTNHAGVEAHRLITDFSGQVLTNLEYVPVWNVLMAQVFMTNYQDTLNTFANPKMDYLFSNLQSKLYPGSLPDLGGKFPELVGPLYRFDLLFKKVDWLMKKPDLTELDLATIQLHITTMETIVKYIETDKKVLLDAWPYKNTLAGRKIKLEQVKTYLADDEHQALPVMTDFFTSREFTRAYQCYSCHKDAGLGSN